MKNLIDNFDHPSPNKVRKKKPQYFTTMIHVNTKFPPLYGGKYQKIGGMWTLKYKRSSPKFYKLLIKTKLKVDNLLYLKNFYNQLNICLNVVTKLQEDHLPAYQKIKWHSKFHEKSVPDRYLPSFSCNDQMYTFLDHSFFVDLMNCIYIKYSMETQV